MTRTLEELDQALQALEQTQIDQLVPGVFSINSAGQVEELLSGNLTTNNITFPTSSQGFINYLDPNGEQVAWVRGQETVNKHAIEIVATASNASTIGAAVIQLGTNLEAGTGQITVKFNAQVERTLLDKTGASSFLQLAAAAKRRVTLGEGELEWPGASQTSNVTEVKGFPGTAVGFYFVQPHVTDTLFFAAVSAPSPTQFSVQGWSALGVPPAGHKQAFYYLAIND